MSDEDVPVLLDVDLTGRPHTYIATGYDVSEGFNYDGSPTGTTVVYRCIDPAKVHESTTDGLTWDDDALDRENLIHTVIFIPNERARIQIFQGMMHELFCDELCTEIVRTINAHDGQNCEG